MAEIPATGSTRQNQLAKLVEAFFIESFFFIFSKVLLFYFYKQNSVRSVIFIVMKKGACADNIFYIF